MVLRGRPDGLAPKGKWRNHLCNSASQMSQRVGARRNESVRMLQRVIARRNGSMRMLKQVIARRNGSVRMLKRGVARRNGSVRCCNESVHGAAPHRLPCGIRARGDGQHPVRACHVRSSFVVCSAARIHRAFVAGLSGHPFRRAHV
jgi:hypothetical protein